MTVYVFGAGASRDAGYPLANELGKSLLDWTKQPTANSELCIASLEELFELYGDLHNLEHILAELDSPPTGSRVESLSRERRGRLKMYVRVAISEFFHTLRASPAPLYKRLAQEKAQAGDVIITFNYDTACERELKVAGLWEIVDGYGFLLNDDTVPSSKVSLLKLHGSANWLEVAFRGLTSFSQGSPMALGSRPVIPAWEFDFLGYSKEFRDSKASSGRFGALPAMIMPTLNKQFYEQTSGGRELEDFWNSLWLQAEQALASSEAIVIIGFGMATADERARSLLLASPNLDARLGIFCGERTRSISDEFVARGYRQVYTSGNHRFEDYLNSY